MATGDLAASAGLSVFPGTQDARLGYDNDNVRGDEIADHILNGGHDWSKITGKPAKFPPAITVSDSAPSGGVDGDIWLEY